MNRLKWLLLFLVITCSANAQQFKLVEDTIRINASDFISPISRFEMRWAVKYHEYYFCIFEDYPIYRNWNSKNRLLVISENGKDIVEMSLPKDFQTECYGDLFIRHDTLYLKPYHTDNKQMGYYFDIDTREWILVNDITNTIYEDEWYRVAVVDNGEWGNFTWFIEKQSNLEETEYIIKSGMLSRIIKKDSAYYFISKGCVDTLLSLDGKSKICELGQTYEDAIIDKLEFLDNINRGLIFDDLSLVPNIFHFIGRDEDSWGNVSYDTLCINAFLTNRNIYYLLNTEKKTYIAQLEDGKMREKFSFGHRYNFFRVFDNYRGKNLAQNQCFEQFEENINSYGVLEIKDTLIHICHIIHNQDSLPHIGKDNIEPLLQYLLSHLDNLTLPQIDSVEKVLQATCHGEIKTLTCGYYFPPKIQTDEFRQISYLTTVDNKKTLLVNYCLNKNDSVINGVFFDWLKTGTYKSYDVSLFWDFQQEIKEFEQIVKQKCAEVSQILTTLTGVPPVEVTDNNSNSKFLMWTYHNIIVKLYPNGRISMYLTDE